MSNIINWSCQNILLNFCSKESFSKERYNMVYHWFVACNELISSPELAKLWLTWKWMGGNCNMFRPLMGCLITTLEWESERELNANGSIRISNSPLCFVCDWIWDGISIPLWSYTILVSQVFLLLLEWNGHLLPTLMNWAFPLTYDSHLLECSFPLLLSNQRYFLWECSFRTFQTKQLISMLPVGSKHFNFRSTTVG